MIVNVVISVMSGSICDIYSFTGIPIAIAIIYVIVICIHTIGIIDTFITIFVISIIIINIDSI